MKSLVGEISANLWRYRNGDFHFLSEDPACFFSTDVSVNLEGLQAVSCTSDGHREVECCLAVWEALGNVPPYLARDARLWTYLTHTALLDYTRTRWPIPENDESAVTHIRRHFFAENNRVIERDNAASRLWWMAQLCSEVSGLSLREALQTLLHQSDVRANIIERPTTTQNRILLDTLLQELHRSLNGDRVLFEREKFRAVMKELNLLGGVKLLGALKRDAITAVIREAAHNSVP